MIKLILKKIFKRWFDEEYELGYRQGYSVGYWDGMNEMAELTKDDYDNGYRDAEDNALNYTPDPNY